MSDCILLSLIDPNGPCGSWFDCEAMSQSPSRIRHQKRVTGPSIDLARVAPRIPRGSRRDICRLDLTELISPSSPPIESAGAHLASLPLAQDISTIGCVIYSFKPHAADPVHVVKSPPAVPVLLTSSRCHVFCSWRHHFGRHPSRDAKARWNPIW